MERYYKPSLDEFHVGFEYEAAIWRIDEDSLPEGVSVSDYINYGKFSERVKKYPDVVAKRDWKKMVWDEYSRFEDLMDVEMPGKIITVSDCYRVKYLDTEDIESLGFIPVIPSNIKGKERENYIPSWFVMDMDGLYKWQLLDCGKSKFLIDYGMYDKRDKSKGYFQGVIKNKSELETILKQIGVI